MKNENIFEELKKICISFGLVKKKINSRIFAYKTEENSKGNVIDFFISDVPFDMHIRIWEPEISTNGDEIVFCKNIFDRSVFDASIEELEGLIAYSVRKNNTLKNELRKELLVEI